MILPPLIFILQIKKGMASLLNSKPFLIIVFLMRKTRVDSHVSDFKPFSLNALEKKKKPVDFNTAFACVYN